MCTTICTTAKAMIRSAVICLLGERAAHHQPERDRGQHDREHEADHVARERAVGVAVAVAVIVVAAWACVAYRCSSQNSQQIDEGEDADPDDVEEVPEHD